jgi:hypothetical protein
MGQRYVMLKNRMASLERSLLVLAVWTLALPVAGIAVGLANPSTPLGAWIMGGALVGLSIGFYAGWGKSTLALLLRLPAYGVVILTRFAS